MGEDLYYRIVLMVVAGLQGVISRRYMKGAKAGGTIFQKRAEGFPLTIAAGAFYLAYCLTVLFYMVNPAWLTWSALPVPPWSRWIGAMVMALGAALHIWGMHHLGKNLTISISTRAGHTLVTSGPYRWIRHPLYSGGMLESIGVCLLLANGAVAVCAFLFWVIIVCRTPKEEALLREAIGDAYADYAARTGRFLPRAALPSDH